MCELTCSRVLTFPSLMLSSSQVRKEIGPFATPDAVVISPGLPKTRSGKIMRRLLRKIKEGITDVSKLGDISTLKDPSVVQKIIDKVNA